MSKNFFLVGMNSKKLNAEHDICGVSYILGYGTERIFKHILASIAMALQVNGFIII